MKNAVNVWIEHDKNWEGGNVLAIEIGDLTIRTKSVNESTDKLEKAEWNVGFLNVVYEGEEANDLEEGWVEYDIEAMLEELGYKDASDMMYSITDVNIVAPKETSKECKNPHNYRVESGDLTKVFDTETDKCVSLLDDGRLYVTLLSPIEIVGMLESLRAD